MPIESREQKVMKSRVYLIAAPLMAMSDGREKSAEVSSYGLSGLTKRPAGGPAGTFRGEDL